ncbi:probable E3 ubiquitin-protein ligase bre1 [Teleopsis dalmanni]|uniref:probable E3 ubiquitin-protein ligase bre1 n=1 Tax=Teleopsis dalmanni TaxID=139649 RepID=UPI0018CFDADD|nr:probable E3 ubiquitin-protein ligase bre1 [Teleopsis dalmanni]
MAVFQKSIWFLLLVTLLTAKQISGEGLRLPDQHSVPQQQQQQQPQLQNVQQIFIPQQQQQQQQQQPQLQQQQTPAGFGEERGRSSILSLFGLGNDNDPYLARTNSNCLTGDLSECFKTQALNSFDEIFYRDNYRLSDFARIVRMPETQQRSLLQEPFEYSESPRNEDTDWDQLVKYALRRAERFIKSTAIEIDVPEELTEAGRYDARFIGNDIDSELDIIEDKHAPLFTRKKLKKMIIPLLLVLKIFKLKLLLFLPFILGIAGLKKILGLAAIILPGLFAYFKLCRPPGGAPGFGGGAFSGLFGSKNTFPEYSPQGVGSATYYHHHEHYDGQNNSPYYRQDPAFAKPYTDYYSKNVQTGSGNSVSFGDAHDIAYSGYYGRNTGKDIQSEQKS